MNNELLWIVTLLVNFGLITIAFKLFGKYGMIAWTVLAVIVANIEVLKTVEMFGMVTTTGNILFATSFLATDILNEVYGRKYAQKAVLIGFFALLSTTIVMQTTLMFVPHASDWAAEHLQVLFGFLPRVALASATAYLVSQYHDVWAYDFWKRRYGKTSQIWIRNNASTIVSQLIDTTIFCFIAFWNVFPIEVFWDIYITTYILKFVVAIADTPFVYIARYLYDRGHVSDEIS